ITAPSVNQNAKTRRSNWGTFFWRIQICNKKWGFLFKFVIFPPPHPHGVAVGGRVWYHWMSPFETNIFHYPIFFYPMHSSRDISMSSDKSSTLYIYIYIYTSSNPWEFGHPEYPANWIAKVPRKVHEQEVRHQEGAQV